MWLMVGFSWPCGCCGGEEYWNMVAFDSSLNVTRCFNSNARSDVVIIDTSILDLPFSPGCGYPFFNSDNELCFTAQSTLWKGQGGAISPSLGYIGLGTNTLRRLAFTGDPDELVIDSAYDSEVGLVANHVSSGSGSWRTTTGPCGFVQQSDGNYALASTFRYRINESDDYANYRTIASDFSVISSTNMVEDVTNYVDENSSCGQSPYPASADGLSHFITLGQKTSRTAELGSATFPYLSAPALVANPGGGTTTFCGWQAPQSLPFRGYAYHGVATLDNAGEIQDAEYGLVNSSCADIGSYNGTRTGPFIASGGAYFNYGVTYGGTTYDITKTSNGQVSWSIDSLGGDPLNVQLATADKVYAVTNKNTAGNKIFGLSLNSGSTLFETEIAGVGVGVFKGKTSGSIFSRWTSAFSSASDTEYYVEKRNGSGGIVIQKQVPFFVQELFEDNNGNLYGLVKRNYGFDPGVLMKSEIEEMGLGDPNEVYIN